MEAHVLAIFYETKCRDQNFTQQSVILYIFPGTMQNYATTRLKYIHCLMDSAKVSADSYSTVTI